MTNETVAGLTAQFKPDLNKIVSEVKEVAVNPTGCWTNVRGTYTSVKDYYLNFLAPLALIPAVAGFIKGSIIGTSVPFMDQVIRVGIVTGIVQAIVQFVIGLAVMYVVAIILGKIAAKFHGTDDVLAALKLQGYSRSPFMVASILVIVPVLGPLLASLVGLYCIYIFYQGISPMLAVPAEQRIPFAVVSIIVIIVLTLIVGSLIALLIGGGMAMGGL